MSARSGFFITLEGGDGVGKTTQAKRLYERLQQLGVSAIRLREPGGEPTCERIRDILKTGKAAPIAELMLFNAARNHLLETVIRPALADGKVVICDRFIDSTYAYQHYGNRLPRHIVQSIIDSAIGDTLPDVTILLELPPDQAAQRALAETPARDGIAKYDTAGAEMKQRILNGYRAQLAENPARIKEVSAEGSEAEVTSRILEVLGLNLKFTELLGLPALSE